MAPHSFSVFAVSFFTLLATFTAALDVSDCPCGYYDPVAENLFTESIIVYFNETAALPIPGWITQDYHNAYEKSWNSKYTQGAKPDNLALSNSSNASTSLEFWIDPSNPHHLVDGAGIMTERRDIKYGSFRSLMRAPTKGAGGSSISMMVDYNETERIEMDVMNTDEPDAAMVAMLVHNEWPDLDLTVNFTDLAGNMSVANQTVDAWDFVEYRIDWTEQGLNWSVDTNLIRQQGKDQDGGIPSTPAPIFLKHWSTGNPYLEEGPPVKRSSAEIGWVRMFFNSSVWSEDMAQVFTKRCSVTDACSMDDVSLRGATPYNETSTIKYKMHDNKVSKRWPAVFICAICGALTFFLLVHAFWKQIPKPWQKRKDLEAEPPKRLPASSASLPMTPAPPYYSREPTIAGSPFATPGETAVNTAHGTPFSTRPPTRKGSKEDDDLRIEECRPSSPASSSYYAETQPGTAINGTFDWQFGNGHPLPPGHSSSTSQVCVVDGVWSGAPSRTYSDAGTLKGKDKAEVYVSEVPLPETPAIEKPNPTSASAPTPLQPTRERIDYLAGTVALCSILVTVMHFCLTFIPAVVIPYSSVHYSSELWARKIVSPLILNQMWLGVFFLTSIRFLVHKFLKDGNLKHIANSAVRRTPRLMIPITAAVMLEYFLIDVGATNYLEYLPSITWSTWPYVSRFDNFGIFVSELLELIYLVPNAVPQITYNYCTGVLWTIAVQLQGSWLVLLQVIIIYEIKTQWKRLAYYAFMITCHWYAQSWGAYLMCGLLLADLDITFKWRKYLHSHPLAYYPLLFTFTSMVILGFAANMVPQFYNYNFPTYENNIHPDLLTGMSIGQTANAGYPDYYIPRLNGLVFAVGMQAVVEISPWVQKALSNKVLVLVFPHIFTIYLFHGLIFWSWGSWLAVVMAGRGFPFYLNMIIVGITSYAVLFLSLPILTPILEILGKDLTQQIWTSASTTPAPRRPTLFPFAKDLLDEDKHAKDGEESGKSSETNSVKDYEKRSESRFSSDSTEMRKL